MALATMRDRTRGSEPQVELGIIVAGAALFCAAALTRGPALPLMLIAGAALMVLAIARPQAGLHMIVATVVLGDLRISDRNIGELHIMYEPLFGTGITPVEGLMLATGLGVLLQIAFKPGVSARAGELALPIAALLVAIGLGVGVGLSRGADLDVLQQEVQGFFYLPLMYVIVLHTVRSKAHVSVLLWAFVLLVNVMSVEVIHRYFTYVRGGYQLEEAPDLAFAHEDAIFCAAAIIILFARIIWSGAPLREWRSFALLALPMLALLVMKRRAGIIALDGGLILLSIVLLRDNVRLFFVAVPIAVVFAALLLAVTWNEPGGKGQFARSFRTITGQEATVRDQSSDEYRRVELVNVRMNIEDQPITGLGFGREYTFYVPLADLSRLWQMYPYVPHNSVMWVWMKAGIAGFITLLALFGAALMRSTQLTLSLKPGALKAAAFSFGAIALMFLLYSWADLGLISTRALVLFGMALGGIAAVTCIAEADGLQEREASRAG